MDTQVILAAAAVTSVAISLILLWMRIKSNAAKDKSDLIGIIERGDDRVLEGVKNIINIHDASNKNRFDSADKKIDSVSADVREVRQSLDGLKNTLLERMHFKTQD